jgi:hypothetical protein
VQLILSLKFDIRIVDEIVEDIIQTGDATLFRLFSVIRGMSGNSARDLSAFLKRIERMLRQDGQVHDATIVFDKIALTFILADDAVAARLRLDAIRQKRDYEQKYLQEYIVVLSPREHGSRRSNRSAGREHRFAIRAIAMKQNRTTDDGILAFSPRIPEDSWQVKEETDSHR